MVTSRDIINTIKLRHMSASHSHMLMEGGDGTVLMATFKNEAITLAALDGNCEIGDQEFLRHAHDDVGTLIDMVERAAKIIKSHDTHTPSVAGQTSGSDVPARERTDSRRAGRNTSTAKNHTAECAIYCNYPWFKKFLIAKHGLDLPRHMDDKLKSDMTALKVRSILKISSRKQLNTNKNAATRWKYLRQDAWDWRGFRGSAKRDGGLNNRKKHG